MTRWLRAPILTATLFVVWLLLTGTVAAGPALLGAILAWWLPHLLVPFTPGAPLKRPGRIVALAVVVLRDIVVSNIDVARRILGPERALAPGFVRVPLAISDPRAIVALASIVTMTPGTLSADIAPDGSHLVVHALHVTDPDALVAAIKARYEVPLKEIFE